MRYVRGIVVVVLAACSGPARRHETPHPLPAGIPQKPVTITILGTNDLHGALERLPVFAGFVANARAARAADGGGVLLVDAGDMFQGTLESNLAEGADVVTAYNRIGYAASAVGNHEFDYGPVGPAVTAKDGEDPRGALKARAAEARFPLLASNIVDASTHARIDWPNMPAATLVEVAGVKIGIVGASTEATPYTTMPANFAGLAIAPPADAIASEAAALRAQGARVIVATMHIGSKCKDLDHPDDASSCDHGEEVFKVIDGLPPHAVDVIVAGHTHAGMAHRIKDIAVIESFSSGRAFGRVDLEVAPDGRVAKVTIDKPHPLCADDKGSVPVAAAACKPGDYEGKPVVADAGIQQIVDAALARAGERRQEKLGITLAHTVNRAYGTESAEGNLFTDLMLAARPDAQVALTNGGGLRADLPAGELTYGQLFEAMPFDNRFAIVDVTGKDLRELVATNLAHGAGILSWGGLAAKARCKGDALDVQITVNGKPLVDKQSYKLVTSDFLASGGDGLIGHLHLPDTAIHMTDAIIRDAIADVLRQWKSTKKSTIDPEQLYSPKHRRMDYEGERPVACGKAGAVP